MHVRCYPIWKNSVYASLNESPDYIGRGASDYNALQKVAGIIVLRDFLTPRPSISIDGFFIAFGEAVRGIYKFLKIVCYATFVVCAFVLHINSAFATCSAGYYEESVNIIFPTSNGNDQQYKSNSGSDAFNDNSDDDLSNGEWKIKWTSGNITGTAYGYASCNGTNGTQGSTNGSNDSMSKTTTGQYCWCKTTKWNDLDLFAEHVFFSEYNSNLACANVCSVRCATFVSEVPNFRSAVFGAVQPTCTVCTNAPANSHYTGSGTSATNCSWECDAGYFLLNGSCLDCTTGLVYSNGPYYCPGDNNRYQCPEVDQDLENRILWYQYWPPNFHDTVENCIATISDDDPDGDYEINAWFRNGRYGGGYTQTFAPVSCVAGKYSTIQNTPQWVGYSTNSANTYDGDIDSMKGRVCTDVGAGYYSPAGDTARYECTNKPANSHFACSGTTNTREWECDNNYTEYNNTCHGACSGLSTLHAGSYSYPLFADKVNVPSPVIHIKDTNNNICYAYMEADTTGNESGLKVRWNNAVYHAIDPR